MIESLDISLLLKDILLRVELRIAKWALLRKEFRNTSLDNIIHNYKVCMFCAPLVARKAPVIGVLLQLGFFFFF